MLIFAMTVRKMTKVMNISIGNWLEAFFREDFQNISKIIQRPVCKVSPQIKLETYLNRNFTTVIILRDPEQSQ